MDALARTISRLRFLCWFGVLAGGAILWATGRPIDFDQSIEGFFPPDHPALLDYQEAKRAFGSDDIVFVVYDDDKLWTAEGMDRVRTLAERLAENGAGAERVDSLDRMPLPWRVQAAAESLAAGRLNFAQLLGAFSTVATDVRAAARRPEALAKLRVRICNSALFRNVLVDPTGRTTALVVKLKDPSEFDSKRAVHEIRRRADAFADEYAVQRVAVVGPPVLLADGFVSLERDNRTLGLVAMGLMALTMLAAVRSPWWALLPLVAGWTTWLVMQSLLVALDLKLTLSAGPIIAQTVVLCMPAASHLAMHFRAASRSFADRGDAARHTMRQVVVPVAWCAVTAAAGYLALLTSSVRPVVQFGLTMAACNLLAGLLAYLLAAGAMQPPSWLRLARPQTQQPAEVESRVGTLTAAVIAHPARVLVLFVAPCLAVAAGVVCLEFESNYIKIYKPTSRVARDYEFAESRLGGIGLVELVFRAPAAPTAQSIEELRRTTARLADVDRELITEVLSLADVVGTVPKASSESTPARSGTGSPAELPFALFGRSSAAATPAPSPDAVLKTKLQALSLPAYVHFLNNFWSRPSNQMRIIVRIREGAPAERKEQVFAELLQQAGTTALIEQPKLTGLSHLMSQVTRALITTQFRSTALACGIILVMLLLALRSLRLAVLALLPTLLAIGLVLGAMGWLGLKIDLSTALVASVAAGLAVDDTFHCLLRWKQAVRSGLPAADALRTSYAGAGPGVLLSSAAVSLGFLALVFSEFMPTANFGWLVAVATLGGSLGNLVVLPACLALGRSSSGMRSSI